MHVRDAAGSEGAAINAVAPPRGKRVWGRTIELIDDRFEVALREGLFALEGERTFIVTDSFDNGAEMLRTVREWQGTRIPPELEQRAGHEHGAVHVHQDIRLRLLRAVNRTAAR